MLSFNLSKEVKHIHLIGIGGISMSGIAEILLKHNYHISGSDIKDSSILEKLRHHGADIYIGHTSENVKHPDLIVYTAAVKEDNPERIRGKELQIPEMDRAEMLGIIMKSYERSIAVAGSHGKTTTTSLLSIIMEESGLDPTILVGGELKEIGGNVKIGDSPILITEACEYVEGFLRFNHFIGVILNIDADHLDYFKDLAHVKEAFRKFAFKIPPDGFLVANSDDLNVVDILEDLKCNVITFGIHSDCTFKAEDIGFNKNGLPHFKVLYNNKHFGDFQLSIPGEHNVYNALASISAAFVLGIPVNKISSTVSVYGGTHRRFDKLGEGKGVHVVDDYAHHPAEVRATLKAAKNYPHNRIWCVFQPHTYTRTLALFHDFAKAFYHADYVIVTDIYAAREKDEGKIHSKTLVEEMDHKNAIYLQSFEEITDYLYKNVKPHDLVLTMGAGDIYKVGEELLKRLNV